MSVKIEWAGNEALKRGARKVGAFWAAFREAASMEAFEAFGMAQGWRVERSRRFADERRPMRFQQFYERLDTDAKLAFMSLPLPFRMALRIMWDKDPDAALAEVQEWETLQAQALAMKGKANDR